jgi:hypothetical protein
MNANLEQRVVDALDWDRSGVRSLSLQSLRELLKSKGFLKLAVELDRLIRTGRYIEE